MKTLNSKASVSKNNNYETLMKDLHELLFDAEKSIENYNKVNEIEQMVQKYINGFPFDKPPYFAYDALQYICNNYEFETVLDVGCGSGFQSQAFLENGKKVTAIDYGKSDRSRPFKEHENFSLVIGDFNTYEFNKKFDCVWAAHVLEHQIAPHNFLRKILDCVYEGGGNSYYCSAV